MISYRKKELEKKIAKDEFFKLVDFRNRYHDYPIGFEEDTKLLDRVLDLLELIMSEKYESYFIDELEQYYLEKE